MVAELSSIRTRAALTIAILLWASAFVGIRIALEGYSPGCLALFRFIIASICMGLIYCCRPKREKFGRRDFYLLLIFGALGLGCYNVFLNYAEISVSAGITSFVISQSPLITMFCAILFLGEGFNVIALLGTLISIAGVALITLGQHNELRFDSGMVFLLLATVVNGLYSVFQKYFLKKYHAVDVTIYIIWGGTIALMVYSPNLLGEIKAASLNATLAVIYLGIFPAAIAYLAWSYALSAIPVSKCVSFLYFMPVMATLLGWLCLGEVPGWMSLMGGLIALFGVWIANKAFMK